MSAPRPGAAPGRSPLRGRYLVQNPVSNAVLRAIDGVLGASVARAGAAPPRAPLRRVLVSVGGHLGDAVIATSVLPVLRRALPNAEIGLLLGSWARQVVEGHPLLCRIHTVDHWYLNRGAHPRWSKVRHYRATRERALREIREAGYDAAVDLYPYFPNAAALLRDAEIPLRIGYESGGLGPLFTHPAPWRDSDLHTARQHLELLGRLPIDLDPSLPLRYDLPPVTAAAEQEAAARLAEGGVGPEGFVVFHVGTGSASKEWPPERWRALAEAVAGAGNTIVFTGSGAAEEAAVARVAAGLGNGVNLCGRLSWGAFVAALKAARWVVGVDSVAGHVAAAVGTPCTVVMAGMINPRHWEPVGSPCSVVSHPMPCAPCFRSQGCAGMECVRGVEVSTVLETIRIEEASATSPSPQPLPGGGR